MAEAGHLAQLLLPKDLNRQDLLPPPRTLQQGRTKLDLLLHLLRSNSKARLAPVFLVKWQAQLREYPVAYIRCWGPETDRCTGVLP